MMRAAKGGRGKARAARYINRGFVRLAHLYWRFARGMTLGVRGLVLDDAGAVFLVKHSYVPGWHLPGGGIETGETALDALARELLEEGELVVTAPPTLFGFYLNARASRRDHVALFVVREFSQRRRPVPNREIIDHGFFGIDALPEDTTPATRRRIGEVMAGAVPAAEW